jgi:hypothetical protein
LAALLLLGLPAWACTGEKGTYTVRDKGVTFDELYSLAKDV